MQERNIQLNAGVVTAMAPMVPTPMDATCHVQEMQEKRVVEVRAILST